MTENGFFRSRSGLRNPAHPQVCKTNNAHAGITLIELIAALGIMAILAVLVVPSFKRLRTSRQLTAQTSTLLSALHYAKSEAIKRNQRVVICRSNDQQHCAGRASWNSGWLIFVDAHRGRRIRRDAGDPILIHHVRAERGTRLASNRRFFRFEPNGTATNGTFRLCSVNHLAAPRALIISIVGRIRVSRQAPSGEDLRCP